jgi:uncharacterized protein YndB with AHSA1/START domain
VGRPLEVSDEVTVRATAQRLYALLSDPTAMARWSPENTGARGFGGPLAVGDTFRGSNRRGPLRWSTECRVTAADPDRRFAFTVTRWGLGDRLFPLANASWEYRLEPVEGGTRVTETWTDDRPWPDAVAAMVDRLATGGSTFPEFQRRNIRATLDRLKAEVESAPAG